MPNNPQELLSQVAQGYNTALNPSEDTSKMTALEEMTLKPRLQELENRVSQMPAINPANNLQELIGHYTNFTENTKLSPAQKEHVNNKLQGLINLHNRKYGSGITQTVTDAPKEMK